MITLRKAATPGTLEAPTGQDGETQTIKLIYRPGDIVV
jgi:hypothetical protein